MLERVGFTVSYAPVAGIRSLRIIIAIESTEGLILFVLDISNNFQNTFEPTLQKEYISVYLIYIWIGTKENPPNIH